MKPSLKIALYAFLAVVLTVLVAFTLIFRLHYMVYSNDSLIERADGGDPWAQLHFGMRVIRSKSPSALELIEAEGMLQDLIAKGGSAPSLVAEAYSALLFASPDLAEELQTKKNRAIMKEYAEQEEETEKSIPSVFYTYSNNDFGFSLHHPIVMEKTYDKIHMSFDDAPDWYRVEFAAEDHPQKPRLLIDVNPDGYGPIFADKIYKVRETPYNLRTLDIIEIEKDEYNDDGKTLIVVDRFTASNGNDFYMLYSFQDGSEDLEGILGTILSEFKIYK